MIRKGIFTIIHFLLLINIVNATKIPLYDISLSDLYLEDFSLGLIIDSSQTMNINDIATIKNQAKIINSRFAIKSIKNNYWFIIDVKNSSKKSIKKILGFDEVYMETADIYYQNDTAWHHEQNGLSEPMNQRQIQNRCPVFYISLNPEETKTIYLKLHSKFALVCGISIEEISVFARNEQKRIMGYWMYFGAAVAIIMYNIFLLIQIRDRVYLYYVIYASCLVIFVFLYSGYSLYVNSSVKLHYMLHASIATVGIFIALFTRELLKTKDTSKWIDYILIFISVVYAMLGLLIITDIYFYQGLVLFGMPSVLFFLFTGVYCLIKRVQLARFYVIAMSCYLIGLFMIAAVNLGIIPFNTVTRYGFIFGSFIELLVFSLALGYRIKLLQLEKNTYQQKILFNERSMKKNLEFQVIERTEELTSVVEELHATNEQLVKLSNFKENMTNMIAHDLKNPLNSIINISSMEGVENREELVEQTGRQMLNLVTNMLDVYKSENTNLILDKTESKISDIVKEAFEEVAYLIKNKNLEFEYNIDRDYIVKVDKEIIKRVLINLFTNAIKFSTQKGLITIICSINSDNELRIAMENHGEGILKEKQESIFELYKQDKKRSSGSSPSSGLGLAFCKLAIESHQGKIGVISESETGVEFWFTLPDFRLQENQSEISTISFKLEQSDKAYLQPFIEQIRKYNIFEISSLNDVLNKIEKKNVRIGYWLIEMDKAIYSGNEKAFSKLTDF